MADVRCVYFGTDGKPKETKNADTVVVGGGIKTSTGTLTVNGASDVILSTAGTERARILASNGNVGIGVTSPAYLLHARKDVNGTAGTRLENNDSGTTAVAQFLAGDPADSGRYLAMDYNGTGYNLGAGYELLQGSQGVISTGSTTNNGLAIISHSSNANSKIVFGIGDLNAAAEAMRITLAKDVGIGTTAPTASLHVKRTSGTAQTLVEQTATAQAAYVQAYNSGASGGSTALAAYGGTHAGTSAGLSRNGLAEVQVNGNAASLIRVVPNIPLHFSTNEVVRQTILGNGNVSIGTTSDLAQLAVDNGSTAESILVCRDNGTTVLTVEDGGQTDHKTHTAFAGSGAKEHTAAVQTTDATVTTLDAITLADNTLYWIEVNAIGRDTSGTDRAFYKVAVRAHREGGGATLGTINMIVEDETNAAWDCTFDVTGNDVRLRVTGAAATTINWVCTINWQAVSGNS